MTDFIYLATGLGGFAVLAAYAFVLKRI